MAKRLFPLSEVLSVTTGYFLCKNKMEGIRNVVSFFYSEKDIWTIPPLSLTIVIPICIENILKQHPQLKKVKFVKGINIAEFIKKVEAKFGTHIEISNDS